MMHKSKQAMDHAIHRLYYCINRYALLVKNFLSESFRPKPLLKEKTPIQITEKTIINCNFLRIPFIGLDLIPDHDLINQPVQNLPIQFCHLSVMPDRFHEPLHIQLHIFLLTDQRCQFIVTGIQTVLLCLALDRQLLEFLVRDDTLQTVIIKPVKFCFQFFQPSLNCSNFFPHPLCLFSTGAAECFQDSLCKAFLITMNHFELLLNISQDHIAQTIQVSIGQFYGIEINAFAVTVAKTALWIAESQMMQETENLMQINLDFLPLKSYANIVEGNALRTDWESVVDKSRLSYIMGNLPFVGYSLQSKSQKDDILSICVDEK